MRGGGRVGGEEKWGVSGEMIDKKKTYLFTVFFEREKERDKEVRHTWRIKLFTNLLLLRIWASSKIHEEYLSPGKNQDMRNVIKKNYGFLKFFW